MRSVNAAWGTGSGNAAESGQFQEFSYADRSKSGVVDAVNLATIGACFGSNNSGQLRLVDTNGNGHWDAGEPVIFDANNNGVYDGSPPDVVIAGTAPAVGTILSTDSKISFVDSNSNGHWDLGESVIYDGNGNGKYDGPPNDTLISGVAPSLGTVLISASPCLSSQYNYYHRAAFDSGTISSKEVNIVAAHYDDTYVAPFAWNSAILANIVSYP
jgi:hypothetical protein